jgi:hypothetical protein
MLLENSKLQIYKLETEKLYYGKTKTKSKELDHYLKSVISGVPKKLDHFLNSNEKAMTYYTGNWSTDVANNFTEKQSEKIFKNMSKYIDRGDLQFFQKKNKI